MSIAATGGETVSVGAFAVSDSNITLYDYNGLNQLVSVSKNGLTSSYTYDGTGLRQTKTVNGVTTNHIWDGTDIVAETNGEYILKRYYRGANGLIFANLAGIETKYLKDGHGNVTGLANMSGTTLNKAYCYDAFGVEKDINENDTNPFRYCGEYYDNEIDKVYLRARYYSPIQGRFMTEDPIKDGLNWYGYCGNNPVMFVDPSGLKIYVPDHQQDILGYLNILSRDTLTIDSNGYVQIKEKNLDTEDRGVDTELIYQLIENNNTCTILMTTKRQSETSYDNLEAASSFGSDVTVNLNPEQKSKKLVHDITQNKDIKQISPKYISLGHELIHALRGMKGNKKQIGNENMKGYYANNSNDWWWQEELDTVGINYIRTNGTYSNANTWYFTENALRREHGLYERVRY